MRVLNADGEGVFVGGHFNVSAAATAVNTGSEEEGLRDFSSSGFRGCLHSLSVRGQEVDLEKEPVRTANVVPCQG